MTFMDLGSEKMWNLTHRDPGNQALQFFFSADQLDKHMTLPVHYQNSSVLLFLKYL